MSDTTDPETRKYVAVALAVEAARDALASNESITEEIHEAVGRIVLAMNTPA